jgi:hypothetical protein
MKSAAALLLTAALSAQPPTPLILLPATCPDGHGSWPIMTEFNNPMVHGRQFAVRIDDTPYGGETAFVLLSFGGFPPIVDLYQLFLFPEWNTVTGCFLWAIDVVATTAVTDPLTFICYPTWMIPSNPLLIGATINIQAMVTCSQCTNYLGLTFSTALQAVVH